MEENTKSVEILEAILCNIEFKQLGKVFDYFRIRKDSCLYHNSFLLILLTPLGRNFKRKEPSTKQEDHSFQNPRSGAMGTPKKKLV